MGGTTTRLNVSFLGIWWGQIWQCLDATVGLVLGGLSTDGDQCGPLTCKGGTPGNNFYPIPSFHLRPNNVHALSDLHKVS